MTANVVFADRAAAVAYAERWAADWNRRDLGTILAHFARGEVLYGV